jgi:hypothetical protein
MQTLPLSISGREGVTSFKQCGAYHVIILTSISKAPV